MIEKFFALTYWPRKALKYWWRGDYRMWPALSGLWVEPTAKLKIFDLNLEDIRNCLEQMTTEARHGKRR
jgi:hypothetical protein